MDFENFMRENGPLIYTLAIRLTGNASDGQDLAQETFIKAYKNFSEFRGDSLASTWLYRICLNTWKNTVRYEKRRMFRHHDQIDGKEIPSGEPGLGSPLERSYYQSLVRSAMARLEHEDREILVLRDIEDRAYEEIAEILEVPVGTVKSRLARSRMKLRAELAPHLKDIRL